MLAVLEASVNAHQGLFLAGVVHQHLPAGAIPVEVPRLAAVGLAMSQNVHLAAEIQRYVLADVPFETGLEAVAVKRGKSTWFGQSGAATSKQFPAAKK